MDNNCDKILKQKSDYASDKMYKKAKKLHQEFEKELYEKVLNWISMSKPAIKAVHVWTIQISYLFTECIVESVCSIIKRLYYDNRANMDPETLKKHVMNVAMLPEKDEWRTKIIEWVSLKFLERYRDGIITDRCYLKHRNEITSIVQSLVLDRKYKGKETVFMSMLYLLEYVTDVEESNE